MAPLEAFVERVLASGVLSASLTELRPPASSQGIEKTEARLGRRLPDKLRALLGRWDGANLDVIRLVPCDKLDVQEEGLYFANDPAGFMYFLDSEDRVVVLDTDGGGLKAAAADVEDFLTGYVFGSRSEEFMGAQWITELRAAGLAT